MGTSANKLITVEVVVSAPAEKAWEYFTNPEHIVKWNFASDDWHSPKADNDLRPGGKFSSRMEAKDGSFGFDFVGTYNEVRQPEFISYSIEDGRMVSITFAPEGEGTKVTEQFEAESQNSEEMQHGGWQAILDNYKKVVDAA